MLFNVHILAKEFYCDHHQNNTVYDYTFDDEWW